MNPHHPHQELPTVSPSSIVRAMAFARRLFQTVRARVRSVLALLGPWALAVGLAGPPVERSSGAEPGPPGSLTELLDFKSIPRLKSWTTHQASGYDRGGGFYDSGNFLRTEPGRQHVLMESPGPGCIDRMWFTCKSRVGREPYELAIYLDDPGRPALCLDLDTLFSGAHPPFVEPLAGRCGNPDVPARYSYVPLGFNTGAKVVLRPTAPPGTYYYYLPMPFRSSARLEAVSTATLPIPVSGEATLLQEPPEPESALFHADRYDYAPPRRGQDYLALDIKGAGHFAGIVMDRPGHMEGDDRFFIDGAEAPAWHGTGTEDFFNFAWGLSHTAALPLHGITPQPGGPVCYRFALPAAAPFRRSLRIAWEHGHDPEHGPNLDQNRYSGVVFYYLR